MVRAYGRLPATSSVAGVNSDPPDGRSEDAIIPPIDSAHPPG